MTALSSVRCHSPEETSRLESHMPRRNHSKFAHFRRMPFLIFPLSESLETTQIKQLWPHKNKRNEFTAPMRGTPEWKVNFFCLDVRTKDPCRSPEKGKPLWKKASPYLRVDIRITVPTSFLTAILASTMG